MDCRLKCENPGDVVFEMTIKMSAKNWEKLRDQMDASSVCQSYPLWDMRRQVTDLLAQARRVYWPTAPAETDQGAG